MANYKIIIQYDGTRYKGWQRQKTTDQTIQGKIEAILSRQYGRTIEIDGSGRTDAGVHAHGQVANFRLPDACCAGKTPVSYTHLDVYKRQKWKSWYHKPSGREHRETTAGSRSKAGTGRTAAGVC